VRSPRDHLGEVVELRRWEDRPRDRTLLDEPLLLALARVVRVALDAIQGGYREQHVVSYAAAGLRLEQVTCRRGEPGDGLLDRGRTTVDRVHHGLDAGECVVEARAERDVHTGCPAERHDVMTVSLQHPDRPTTDVAGRTHHCHAHVFTLPPQRFAPIVGCACGGVDRVSAADEPATATAGASRQPSSHAPPAGLR
jgi:hypothetical protein